MSGSRDEPPKEPGGEPSEQLELLTPGRAPRARRAPSATPAAELPVARVVLDVTPPHLDREFDYLVPEALSDAAQPGVRCTVRLAGRRVPGFVVERRAESAIPTLQPLLAISGVPVLTAEVLRLARTIAREHAGTLSDVLRLAIPPRHATTEKSFLAQPDQAPAAVLTPTDGDKPGAAVAAAEKSGVDAWQRFRGGAAFLTRLAEGLAPRAAWLALPPEFATHDRTTRERTDWAAAIAQACTAMLGAGKGTVVVVPDHRDVELLCTRLAALGVADVARLTADQGQAARYRAFLRVLTGRARVVVGTRAAAWAPVVDLGLVVCWDDGDDLHAEPRAPYPHTRDVLRARADQTGAAALFGGFARSVEVQAWVEEGWAREVAADRPTVRAATARAVAAGDDDQRDPAARTARLPSLAIRLLREASADGPVLVQVPHAGYVQAMACHDCRLPARCAACHGPITVRSADGPAVCGWCWRGEGVAVSWRCPSCGGARLRSVRVGSARTAEEIGRTVPGVPIKVSSGAAGVIGEVGPEPQVVVATSGAEPRAAEGFAAAVLLDGWVPLARPELRAGEEALRRWLQAAARVQPAGQGGRVLVVADPAQPAVQALIRWDPAGFAGRELAERTELGLPPAAVLAEAWGEGVDALLAALRDPPAVDQLGPEPDSDGTPRVRWRAGRADAVPLALALSRARGAVSATKAGVPPRVRIRAAL